MGLSVTPAAQFRIPDTNRNWPWPRHLNPFYLECKAESAAWCEALNAFSPKAQKAFNLCDFNLLAALAYPLHNKAGLRIACDLMNLFFVIDEHTDISDVDTSRHQSSIVMDALKNPHVPRSKNEWVGGEATRQFWANAIQHTTPVSQRRFIEAFQLYMDQVVQQAIDRSRDQVRTVRDYFDSRRETIGARPSFAILAFEMNLPDEVLSHPTIVALSTLSIDMMILDNDIYSYNVEQARGDDAHNIVTVVMHEFKTNLEGAMNWIGKHHEDLETQFLELYRNLPSWGDSLDADVVKYVGGVANWVRGNEAWAFECERYFGTKGLEIQKSRVVDLLPKQARQPDDIILFPNQPTGQQH